MRIATSEQEELAVKLYGMRASSELRKRGLMPRIEGGAGWALVAGQTASVTTAAQPGTNSLQLPGSATVGNVIVAASVYGVNSAAPTFSSTVGGSWTTLGSYWYSGATANMAVGFAVVTSGASPSTISVDWPAHTSGTVELYIGEFQHPAGTVSQDGTAQAATYGSTANPLQAPAGNGSGDNDLLIAMDAFSSSPFSSFPAGTYQWTTLGPSRNGHAVGYLLNAPGNATPNVNQLTSPGAYAGLTVAIKAVAEAPSNITTLTCAIG